MPTEKKQKGKKNKKIKHLSMSFGIEIEFERVKYFMRSMQSNLEKYFLFCLIFIFLKCIPDEVLVKNKPKTNEQVAKLEICIIICNF